ncbi:type II secretion system F family protein [Halanaerobacter jeridensis]|uniref:Tight adherence protein C n=1 Tax=Halanaerobacter jeridensis TaxID=706427 RepID=A0A938XPL8_9FIRM|nr:type II secretion system F family protein [Halanaerobacter jeridensis]MBM7557188.1 tight adherence protein C [Halanaerobacter jeridensis]
MFVIAASLGVMVTIFVLAIMYLFKEDETVDDRLKKYTGSEDEKRLREEELDESFWERVLKPVVEKVSTFFIKFTPSGIKDNLRRRLILAGNPLGLGVKEFLALQGSLILILPGGLFITLFFLGAEAKVLFTFSLLTAISALIIPIFLLGKKISERQSQIQRSLPDVLDLLTVSVEAGLGFDAALVKVVDKVSGPISEEFERLLQEIRMGKPRRDAMRDLGKRTNVDDLTKFITSIVQADKLGVSIGKVLRVQSDQIRQRRRQRAEATAMKAPVKMLLPLILFIFPTIFIVLLGPAVIKIMNSFSGMN